MLFYGNGKPLFEQLKDTIMFQIERGVFSEGNKIPSERELAERYSISRVTVRQALSDLVNVGILTKQHGKGYFVATKKIEHKLGALFGFIEEFENRNMTCETHVIEQGFITPSTKILKELDLPPESSVFLLVRSIIVDGESLAVDYSYLPESIAYILRGLNLENSILYRILEQNGYNIAYADQFIEADIIGKENAEILGASDDKPALVIKRTTRLNNGQPIHYCKTIYRADRYNYLLKVHRYPSTFVAGENKSQKK